MTNSNSRQNLSQNFQPEIRRGRIDKLTFYEVSDSELEILAHGSSSIFLNFAIFLLSVAISFTITLLVANIGSGNIYTFFIVVTIICYIVGFLFLFLWWKKYKSVPQLVDKIRKRLPPEGEAQPVIKHDKLSKADEIISHTTVKDTSRDAIPNILIGTWYLQFGPPNRRGQEMARIDKEGNYYVAKRLAFNLKYISYEKSKNTISYDKITPENTLHHREILRIVNNDLLEGHRDGEPQHLLRYERRGQP